MEWSALLAFYCGFNAHRIGCPVVGSQMRSVLSSEADISQVPSGATAHPLTGPVWPVIVWRVVPVAVSQMRSVLSNEADTSQVPSGATAHPITGQVWPSRVRRVVPV